MKESMMKRMMTVITIGVVAVTVTRPALSLEFVDQAAADADGVRQAQRFNAVRENMEKGKTDDAALKEAIRLVFGMRLLLKDENPIAYTQEYMSDLKIPRERQIKTFEDMIRENLSAQEKDEKIDPPYRVAEFIDMLGTFQGYEVLPLLRECLKSKNEIIRNGATRRYDKIMEMKQAEQPKEKGEN